MSYPKKSLILNGVVYKYKIDLTIHSLLTYLNFNTNLIVIDYNGSILQKEFWHQTNIKPNDNIEILTIAGGG